MSQGVGLASCLPKTAWPPTWLIIIAVLVASLFAVGVPVLASTAGNNPAAPSLSNGYGPGCVDSGTLARVATVLGLTPADLATQIQSRKTLAAIAAEKKVATSALIEAIIANFQARVTLQVQNGYLTQTQAQTYLDAARQAAANLLTLNLATAGGSDTWAGFCGEYLGNGTGFGPGMMGGRDCTGLTTGTTATPGIGWGMMGGGFGRR